MNRTGLLIALSIAVVAGLVFGVFPQLDISISRYFFEQTGFRTSPSVDMLRDVISWLIAALAAPGFVAIAVKLLLPRSKMLIPARAAALIVVTLALGPGLLTNIILKDNWGRARPYAVTQLGGAEKFTAWWDPRGTCVGNCSFVAGEPSGAFWTFAPATVLVPAPYIGAAYAGVVAFGTAVGVMRIAYGAHFTSDVIFAGVLTFLLIWTMHGLLYRWRTRISDEDLENQIGSVTRPIYDLIVPPPSRPTPKPRKRKRPAPRKRRP